jgi:hypothetical protein
MALRGMAAHLAAAFTPQPVAAKDEDVFSVASASSHHRPGTSCIGPLTLTSVSHRRGEKKKRDAFRANDRTVFTDIH